MKILLAVDGSTFTKRMLAYLAAHDEWLGDKHHYTLLTAVPAIPPRAAAVLDKKVIKQYYEDEAEKVLKSLRKFFDKQGIKADFLYKVGHAAEVLTQAASEGKFDLLVMGSHGHGALGNLVLGSVATKVMASTEVPVLLIR